jgi:hypothetical protein
MKKFIILFVFVMGALAYSKYQARNTANEALINSNNMPLPNHYIDSPSNTYTAHFTCDGRKHCSEMSSCQEATFFLKNCPDVQMDGNNDGVPCETQWCR